MMEFVAAYRAPQPVRPTAMLIDAAKMEVRWILLEGGRDADLARYALLRAMLVAQWRAARSGALQPDFFYSTARSMAVTLGHLIATRRVMRLVRQ